MPHVRGAKDGAVFGFGFSGFGLWGGVGFEWADSAKIVDRDCGRMQEALSCHTNLYQSVLVFLISDIACHVPLHYTRLLRGYHNLLSAWSM